MTGVEAARTILEVEAQQLEQRFGPRPGAGEARAVYGAEFASRAKTAYSVLSDLVGAR